MACQFHGITDCGKERLFAVRQGTAKASEHVTLLWANVRHVEQPEDLPTRSTEVAVVAARVSELRDARRAQLLLVARNIGCSKLDPGSSERGAVVHPASADIFR